MSLFKRPLSLSVVLASVHKIKQRLFLQGELMNVLGLFFIKNSHKLDQGNIKPFGYLFHGRKRR